MNKVPNFVCREMPVELPNDYRLSAINAVRLVFNVPLAAVRTMRVGWHMALDHARNTNANRPEQFAIMMAGLSSAPVATAIVVFQGLRAACRGRLLFAGFEETGA